VFKREITNTMYKVTPYFLAINCVALLSFLFYPIITTSCVFYGLGLPVSTARAFFDWMGTLTMTAFCGSAFGMMLGCYFTNEITAMLVNELSLILISMGSGMLVNTGSSASFVIKFITWISPIHYSCDLLMYRLLDGRKEYIVE